MNTSAFSHRLPMLVTAIVLVLFMVVPATAQIHSPSTHAALSSPVYPVDMKADYTAFTTKDFNPETSVPQLTVRRLDVDTFSRSGNGRSPDGSQTRKSSATYFLATADWPLDEERAYAVAAASDGGYVAAGLTRSIGAGDDDLLLIKYDHSGAIAWSRTFGGAESDTAEAVTETADGGFLVAGHTHSSGAGLWDTLLLKLDSSGNLVWGVTVGGPGTDKGKELAMTADGGCVVAGYTTSFGYGGSDLILHRFDGNGALLWTRTAGWAGDEYGYGIDAMSDGGFVVTGRTTSMGSGTDDLLVVKWDSAGTLLWARTTDLSGDEYGQSICELSSGEFVVAGYTGGVGAGGLDVMVMHYSSEGWYAPPRTAGGPDSDFGYTVVPLADGGYAVAGATRSFGYGDYDGFLLKYSAADELEWASTMGGPDIDVLYGLCVTEDGEFAAAGTTSGFDTVGMGLLMVKTTDMGTIPGCASFASCSPSTDYHWPDPFMDPSIPSTSPTVTTATPSFSTETQTPDEGSVCDFSIHETEYFLTAAGGDSADSNRCGTTTLDGGYVSLGEGYFGSSGDKSGLLVKYDHTGAVEWSRVFGEDGGHSIVVKDVVQTPDLGFIVLANGVYSYPIYPTILLKFDHQGTLEWARGYDNDSQCLVCEAITVAPDGGLVMAGTVCSGGFHPAVLIKTTPDGDIDWAEAYAIEISDPEYTKSITTTPDGGYAVAASCTMTNKSMVLTYSGSGTLEDAWLVGGSDVYQPTAIEVTDAGFYMLSGTIHDTLNMSWSPFLARLSSTGDLQWARTKTESQIDIPWSITEAEDDSIVMIGEISETDPNYSDLYLVWIDSRGTLSWGRTLGDEGKTDYGSHVQTLADGGFLVSGSSDSYTTDGSRDLLLFRMDASGWIPNCPHVEDYTPHLNVNYPSVIPLTYVYLDFFADSIPLSVLITEPVLAQTYICAPGGTVSAELVCLPSAGTVPFTTQMTTTMTNNYDGLTRRMAARIDVVLAGGASFSNWKSGWSNVAALDSVVTQWNQSIPALGSVIGDNTFTITAEDVTPSPYNQPPHPMSGDVDTDLCVVTGIAP